MRRKKAGNTGRWGRLRAALPVAVIVALPILFLGRGLLPGRVLSPASVLYEYYPWKAYADPRMPANSALADVAIQGQPWLLYIRNEIKAGRFPLWNPHTFAGSPFVASMQTALFSPFTFTGLFGPETKAPAVVAILKLLVAGLSMFWFLRLIPLSRPASALGGVAFMFSGFMTTFLGWPHTSVVAWLPLMMGLVHRLRSTVGWGYAGLLSLVTAAQMAGGHPDTSLQMLLVVAAWAAFLLRGPGASRFAVRAGVALGLGVAIASAQILPFVEYLSNCAASHHRFASEGGGLMPVRWAFAILIPDYFGNTANGNYTLADADYNEIAGWVGIAPLVLLPCAVLSRNRRPAMWFCLGLSAFSFLSVYSNPLMSFLIGRVHLYWVFINTRMLLPLDFGLAALGAFGLDALTSTAPRKGRRALMAPAIAVILLVAAGAMAWRGARSRAILQDTRNPMLFQVVKLSSRGLSLLFIAYALSGSALAAAALASRRLRPAAVGGLFALEVASLLPNAATYNTVVDASKFYPETPAIAHLASRPGIFRTWGIPNNVSSIFGISDIVGSDAMTPDRIERLIDGRGTIGVYGNLALQYTRDINSPVLDLFNTRYVLAAPGVGPPGPKWSVDYRNIDGWILRNNGALPRAFLVFRTTAEPKKEADTVDMLVRGELDLRKVALLPAGRPGLAGDENSAGGTAEITGYQPARVSIRTSAPASSCLVLLDTYFLGWRALIDGKRTRIERADYAFRGVLLNPGRHTVEFVYNPLPFRIGLLVSCAALVMAVLLAGGWLTGRLRPSSRWNR